MIIPHSYQNKTVAVVGLGRSGLSTVRALLAAQAEVLAWDDNDAARAELAQFDLSATDLDQADWSTIDTLILSPGIPHTYPKPHRFADKAREFNCPILCDVDLLVQAQPNAQYVAITGTNGKSTTTALTHHVLEVAGFNVQVGGNLGIPVLDLDPLDETGIYVLEMSSYQLERSPSLSCDVAVLLNITPDHLDRHGGMAGYIHAKRNIFNNQNDAQFAFIGVDDAHSETVFNDIKQNTPARTIALTVNGPREDAIFVDEDILIDEAFDDEGRQVMDLSALPVLPGKHNQQNVAAAYAIAVALGADPEWIVRGIASFSGLAHRQERVCEFNGVTFVNDSKATNAEAAQKALSSYENIYWIAGGQAKDGGIDSLKNDLAPVKAAFLIGEAAETFAQTLDGICPTELSGTLTIAIEKAYHAAKSDGGVVLLSPACASFDQFKNFEARGDAFKNAVKALWEREEP